MHLKCFIADSGTQDLSGTKGRLPNAVFCQLMQSFSIAWFQDDSRFRAAFDTGARKLVRTSVFQGSCHSLLKF